MLTAKLGLQLIWRRGTRGLPGGSSSALLLARLADRVTVR